MAAFTARACKQIHQHDSSCHFRQPTRLNTSAAVLRRTMRETGARNPPPSPSPAVIFVYPTLYLHGETIKINQSVSQSDNGNSVVNRTCRT